MSPKKTPSYKSEGNRDQNDRNGVDFDGLPRRPTRNVVLGGPSAGCAALLLLLVRVPVTKHPFHRFRGNDYTEDRHKSRSTASIHPCTCCKITLASLGGRPGTAWMVDHTTTPQTDFWTPADI